MCPKKTHGFLRMYPFCKILFRIQLLYFISFLNCSSATAQKETYHWIFGNNYHLDFNQTPVKFTQDGAIVKDTGQHQYYSCTAISDKNGNLLFYSNGETVWNKTNAVMENGEMLKCNKNIAYSFNSIVVPVEDLPGIYYLFTLSLLFDKMPGKYLDSTIYYHIIDMKANNGLGKVISKNNQLATFSCNSITAIKHKNGRDTWIISRNNKSYNMVSWLLSPCGIRPPVFSRTKGYITYPEENVHALSISPNGKLAAMSQLEDDTFLSPGHTYLYNFNDSTGIFTDKGLLLDYNSRPGIFSSDSRYFYNGDGFLYQYDLQARSDSVIVASKINLWHWNENVPIGAGFDNGAFTPDGRIFINPAILSDNTPSIYVLQNPSIEGIAAQLDSTVFVLPRVKNQRDISFPFPHFMPSFFRPGYKTPEPYQFNVNIFGPKVICYRDSVNFSATNQDKPDSVLWSLQSANSKIIWQGKGENVAIAPVLPGKYQLNTTVYRRCLWTQKSISFDVEADPVAKINGKDSSTLFMCESSPLALQANKGNYTYQWSNGSSGINTVVTAHGKYSLNTSNTCGAAEAITKVEGDKWEIPNVITPNGDGINDYWKPKNLSGISPKVQISNRWGTEVFASGQYSNDWNAGNLPDGVYFYNLETEGGCKQKGWVQVLR